MQNKSLLALSLIINLVLIGLVIIIFNTDLFVKSLNNGEYEDFSENFYSIAENQEWYAQSLFLEQMQDLISDDTLGFGLVEIKSFLGKRPKLPKECKPIKDKRKVNIELGELTINIQKGQIANIKGLNISREAADSLLANIFVYDKALSNICITLSGLDKPSTTEERKFILDLMDKQQKVVDSYTSFRLGISQSKNEDEIKAKLEENKEELKKLKMN